MYPEIDIQCRGTSSISSITDNEFARGKLTWGQEGEEISKIVENSVSNMIGSVKDGDFDNEIFTLIRSSTQGDFHYTRGRSNHTMATIQIGKRNSVSLYNTIL